jgi:glycine betaine catabolism B
MKNVQFAKLVLLINCAVPGALLAWDAFHHQLGANPVNFAILTTGMLTLIFLSLSLLVTPIRRITGWNWLIFFRRTLGLYAFFYASAHFLIFFVLDRSMSLVSTGTEMLKRPYLVIGSLGLTCLVPLAVTSTNAMIKRLGAKRWHLLHRLAYVTAVAGVVHFYMQAKADKRKPIAFAVTVGILLGYRLVRFLLDRRQKKNARATVAAAAPPSPSKPRFWSGQLRVARIVQETPTVRTFRLQALDGRDLPFEYLPGQYLNLALLIDGKRINRSYTIASSPTRTATCELTIKREDAGVASRHLHDTIHEGDLLSVSAPAGRFTFIGTEADSIVLIAGGVGITPLMSILRALTDRYWTGEIYLVYCVRQEREIIFARELDSLRKQFNNLHICVTISGLKDASWTGHRGRLTEELLGRTIPDLPRRLCYICGPSAMMSSVTDLLRGLGVPESQIKSEAFVYATHADAGPASAQAPTEPLDKSALPQQADMPTVAAQDVGPTVTFSVSGKTARLLPNQTILEAGEALGLDLEYECRSGICGKCRKRMLVGSVTMDAEDALSPTDKADKLILLCQAKAIQHVTVEA